MNNFLETLISRQTSGKDTNTLWAKITPSEYLYSKGTLRLVKRRDIQYHLDIADTVDHFIYFDFWDKAFERIKSYVTPNSIVIDVGANMGRFALVFASIAKHGRVVCFEPNASSFNKLKRNVDLNDFKHVEIVNKALGDAPAKLSLFTVNSHNAGMNRIGIPDGHNVSSETVSVSKLDDEIDKLGLKQVDLIKIDVEGFEFKVLLGGKKTIEKFKPILFIELVEENLLDNHQDPSALIQWIKNFGYTIFRASDMKPIEDFNGFKRCHFDIICFQNKA